MYNTLKPSKKRVFFSSLAIFRLILQAKDIFLACSKKATYLNDIISVVNNNFDLKQKHYFYIYKKLTKLNEDINLRS